jgi:hypothetical protein
MIFILFTTAKNITGTMPPVVTIDHVCKYSMTNSHEVIKHVSNLLILLLRDYNLTFKWVARYCDDMVIK